MNWYRLTLFTHLLTLIVATAATAVTKLASGRRDRARTVGEMLEWHRILTSAAAVFPICLVVFTASGAYMLGVARVSASAPFAVAGLIGVVLLFASGTTLGIKGKGLRQMLEAAAAKDADQPAPRLAPPFLVTALPTINTGIAIAVVFAMVIKPATIASALAILGAGIVLGLIPALRSGRLSGAEGEGEQLRQGV